MVGKVGRGFAIVYFLDETRLSNYGTPHDKGVDNFYRDVVEGVMIYEGGVLSMHVIKPTEFVMECKEMCDKINEV